MANLQKCITVDMVVGRLQARMAELRIRRQKEFAELIGISQPMLSQILNGDRMPSEEVLKMLKLRHVDHYEQVGK
jgi:predicted transcriptional regulator